MTYEIDLTGVHTPAEFQSRIREVLPVPAWYGNNLDALHDILTERKDWTVRFYHAEGLQEERPRYASALGRLCRECGAEIVG